MKVGLDIDGTITAMPWLFRVLSRGLRAEGHEVYVITFRSPSFKEETEEMLQAMGVVYDKIFYGQQIVDPEWKGKIAQEVGLDVMFEDDVSVLAQMPATVVTCQVKSGWPFRS